MDGDDDTAGKTCSKCGEWRPLDGFCKNRNNKDGLNTWCRGCAAAWRKANKEKMRGYQAKWLANPENKARAAAKGREWAMRPENRKRRNTGNRRRKRELRETHPNAIRLMEVKSQPCTDCGKTFPPQIMDMDHVRGERGFSLTIAQVVRPHVTTEMFEAELAKCELRCPTCHRLRHFYNRTTGRPLALVEDAA